MPASPGQRDQRHGRHAQGTSPASTVPASTAPASTSPASTAPGEAGPAGAPSGRDGDGAAAARGWRLAAARYWPAIVPAAVMIALGAWDLARHSAMGNDEVVTRYAAGLGLRQLEHLLRHIDIFHGFYYLLMHGWLAIGSSPAVLRIPSVIGMTIAVVLVFVLARKLTGSAWAALFASLIMALTPVISFYAQTARSYAIVFACVTGVTLVLLSALHAEAAGVTGRPLALRWTGYAALMILAAYLNEMALLVLVAHAVTVLLARYGRRTVQHWAAAAAVSVVVAAPLVAISVREDNALDAVHPGLADLRALFGDYFGPAVAVSVIVAACVVAAVLPHRAWWRARGAGGGAVPAWWARGGVSLQSVAAPLLIPAALLFVESVLFKPLYFDRYVLYGEAGVALLAGAGIWRIGRWLGGVTSWRALAWAPGVVVCVVVLVLQLGAQRHDRTPSSRLFNYGGPSQYLAAHARPGDGVLFFTAFFRKARLGYPADYTQVSDFAMARTPQQTGSYMGVDKPFAQVAALMLQHQRIWVLSRLPVRSLGTSQYQQERVLLGQRFTLLEQHRYQGILLSLWRRD
jgi:mannosyltransferase